MTREKEKEGIGPKFFTLGKMANALGVSKSYTSRRARHEKDVRGVPVHEYVLFEDGKIFGFDVPREDLDEAGKPVPMTNGSARSRVNPEGETERENRSRVAGAAPGDEEEERDRDGREKEDEEEERGFRVSPFKTAGVLGGTLLLGTLLKD